MYFLLNKDTVIAQFNIKGQGNLEYIEMLNYDKQRIPFWITDLETFISNRKAPKHREHIEALLNKCGCNTLSGYINVSHALSLNDTFWVKQDIQKDLTWDNVSLYKNKFNATIAKIAFDGGMYGEQFSSTSPEFTTGGTFAKCWVRENGVVKLVKRGSSGAVNAGLEPYSEYYTSQILDALNINHVKYTLTSKNNKLASKCELFTTENIGLIPYSALSKNGNLGQVVNFYREKGLNTYISEMLIADSIMFNEDRHLGNFGFLVDNNTGKIVDTAPLYDHNISLLCYAMQDDFRNIDSYISKNNKGPKLGGDFIGVARELLTTDTRKKLINMYGFKIQKHPRYNLPDWRIDQLNKLINRQIELILK
jgi:hypothetical protein